MKTDSAAPQQRPTTVEGCKEAGKRPAEASTGRSHVFSRSPASTADGSLPSPGKLTPVGFEPTQLALVELESTPLDYSGKLSCHVGGTETSDAKLYTPANHRCCQTTDDTMLCASASMLPDNR